MSGTSIWRTLLVLVVLLGLVLWFSQSGGMVGRGAELATGADSAGLSVHRAEDRAPDLGLAQALASNERGVVGSDASLRARCLLSSGVPAPEAVVQSWRDHTLIEQVRCDSKGIATLQDTPAVGPLRILGSLEDHTLASVVETRGAEYAYELVFEPTEVLHGTVLDLEGLPVPLAKVAYCRRRESFPLELLRAPDAGSTAGDGGAGVVVCSLQGEFTVPKPGFGKGLQLLAAGEGLTSKLPTVVTARSGDDITLIVHPIYATFFRYRTAQHGGSLADPLLYSGGVSYPWEGEHYEAGDLQDEELTLALLGVEHSANTIGGEPFDDWFYFFGSDDLAEIPDLDVAISVPGYQDWKGRLHAYPLLDGVPVQEVLLEPSAEQFGILIVDVGEQLPRLSRGVHERAAGPLAKLVLEPTAGGRSLFYPLRPPVSRRVEVLGVPFGEYRVFVRSNGTGWRSCGSSVPCPVVVVGPAVAEVRLDSASVGALALEILDASGAPYLEELVLRLDFDGKASHASFSAPPYLLYGVGPGEVSVSLRKAYGRLWDDAATNLGVVFAVEGEVVRAQLRLPE